MVPIKQGGVHQLLVSANAVNLLGGRMYTIKKTQKPARKETCQILSTCKRFKIFENDS